MIDLNEVDIDPAADIKRRIFVGTVCSTVLASHVVGYRLIGINKTFAMICMAELCRRREILGDDFNYESFISEKMKDMPIPSTNDRDIGLINGLIGKNLRSL